MIDWVMRRLIDDYMAELRYMKENAPYVPYLFAAIVVLSLLAFAIQ